MKLAQSRNLAREMWKALKSVHSLSFAKYAETSYDEQSVLSEELVKSSQTLALEDSGSEDNDTLASIQSQKSL